MEWLTFVANDKNWGIEARYVYRVVDDFKITPVPLTPPFHFGLIYYRGELFDVVHLRRLFSPIQQERKQSDDYQWLLLLKWSGKKLALAPDRIGGLLWLDGESAAEDTTIYAQDGRTVERLTPDDIWNKVLELSNGPE